MAPEKEGFVHLRRWLTALVVLPILALILFKGSRLHFVILLLVVSGVGQWEFLSIFHPAGNWGRRLQAIILGSLVLLSFCTAQRAAILCNPTGPLFALVLCLFGLFLFYLLSYGHIEQLAWDLAINGLALLYLPLLLGHFIWLRYQPQGEWWVFWLLLVIFTGDTAAFYCGQAFGQKKLYHEVSPGKTWAGTVGGVAASLVIGAAVGKRLFPEISFLGLVWLSLILGVLGLFGDLFESMLKRQVQVKDAGQVLPGHGGVLDRLDSLLFAAPAVVYARLFVFGL
jgi:phosphatidate cytidylyltransferase